MSPTYSDRLNAYINAGAFSGASCTNAMPALNWAGVSGPPRLVTLNPIVDSPLLMGETSELKRRIRRQLMSDAMADFFGEHDDLLRELAR
jgi:hypothetical protein